MKKLFQNKIFRYILIGVGVAVFIGVVVALIR